MLTLQNQRTARESYDLRALLGKHRGFPSVQEHREETLIYDVEVVNLNAMKNQRTPRGSGDLRALLETHRSFSLFKNAERRH